MRLNKKSIFLCFSCLFLVILIITGCLKIKDNVNKTLPSFSINEAKEWWYGTFKKSNTYYELDETSENVILARKNHNKNNEPFSLKRYPLWDKGITYNIGKFFCVEFPLVYDLKTTALTGVQNINNEQFHQIAVASLQKLVLIKSPNGVIDVRIVTMIPSYEYLQKSGFDISKNHTNHLEQDFSGAIHVKKWNEKFISIKSIENGKVKKLLKPRKYTINNIVRTEYETPSCPESESGCTNGGEWVPFMAHVCTAENHSEGDVVVVMGCAHQSQSYICMYYVCNPPPEDDNDPSDDNPDCMITNPFPTYEDCMCTYWDITYCSGGGGNEGDENTDTNNDPCKYFKDILKKDSIGLGKQPAIDAMVDSSKNGKSEVAAVYRRDGNNNLVYYNGAVGAYNELAVNLPINSPLAASNTNIVLQDLAGFWHNHFFVANQSLNMFSSADVMYLIMLNNFQRIGDPNDFFFGVTTPNDKNYFMTIQDTAKFNSFCNTYLFTDDSTRDDVNKKLTEIIHVDYNISAVLSNHTGMLENRFAKFLKELNTGLVLNELNFATNKMTEIRPNTSTGSEHTPIKVPCN